MQPSARTIVIRGTVQGVGFRPFVYRVALAHGVTGSVRNDVAGVVVMAFGPHEALDAFVNEITMQPPPLAVVRSFEVTPLTARGAPEGFVIAASSEGERVDVDITRDTAVCPACLAEMRAPHDRRYRHPFINCTDCGPRYTIITGLPYDRPATTMAGFAMCEECREEYEDPANRRFHAQPVCCNRCGPRLRLLDGSGAAVNAPDPIDACVKALDAGGIVAVKGVGGFHLACRADRAASVAELRRRKHREEKPLAVMARDIDAAKQLAAISPREEALLTGVERPIVILARKEGAGSLCAQVAPRVATLGVMLPYAPLHHLLFDGAAYEALVMTSGNRSDEPICAGNDEALAKLTGIADLFLLHDRDIYIRNDDSIVRVLDDGPVIIRRARGYVPEPIPAGRDVDGIVACGGILKGTVTVGRGTVCYTSQYLGTIDNVQTLANLEAVLRHLVKVLDVKPVTYACDLHPEGLTRRIAEESGAAVDYVQHHHAHAVACMAENGLAGESLAVVYDGAGYGDDGTVWGGELLRASPSAYTRLGHWSLMPMPGGDAATRHPGRMAPGALFARLGEECRAVCPWMPDDEKEGVLALLRSQVNCPMTSSMGRLFDAAAALLDICRQRTYEGQPAIELEGASDPGEVGEYAVAMSESDGLVIDGPAILEQAWRDLLAGSPAATVGGRFHATVARATALAVLRAAEMTGLETVCLSGGCFQNALLFRRVTGMLDKTGVRVFVHRLLGPNDECISFGQAVIAASRR